jgi:hypothetical protein
VTINIAVLCFSLLYFELLSQDLVLLVWLVFFVLVWFLRVYLTAQYHQAQQVSGFLRVIVSRLNLEISEDALTEQEYQFLFELAQQQPLESSNHDLISALPHVLATTPSSCCICIDAIEKDQSITVLPCSHTFHSSCVDSWLEQRGLCPLCKASVITDHDTDSSNQPSE